MTITHRDSRARARVLNFSGALGVCAVAATIPLAVAATAHADQISDAIDAAAVPITAAQTAIDAVPTASLSATDLAILSGQDAVLSSQQAILDMLETFQSGLTFASPTALSLIDTFYIVPPDYAVQYATTAYIDSLDGSMGDQLSSLFNLVSADLTMLNGDLNAYALSGVAELVGLFGGGAGLPDIFPIPGL